MAAVKVDYVDRELARDGGLLPEDFAVYLEEFCQQRADEAYRLVGLIPRHSEEGNVMGAWLFFWREEEVSPGPFAASVGMMLQEPTTLRASPGPGATPE